MTKSKNLKFLLILIVSLLLIITSICIKYMNNEDLDYSYNLSYTVSTQTNLAHSYEIVLKGEIVNNTDDEIEGNLYITFKDEPFFSERTSRVSFGYIEIDDESSEIINRTNYTVPTFFGNGLRVVDSIVKVEIESQEIFKYDNTNKLFSIIKVLAILGGILLFAYAFIFLKYSKTRPERKPVFVQSSEEIVKIEQPITPQQHTNNKIKCSYCGAKYSKDKDECPKCGASED